MTDVTQDNIVQGVFKPRLVEKAEELPPGEPQITIRRPSGEIKLKRLITIGVTLDDEFYFETSYMDQFEAVYILERAKLSLLTDDGE